MSNGKGRPAYTPENGSTLADIVRTEELGDVQDEETEEQRNLDQLDRDRYERMSSADQEDRERQMDFTHWDRVATGQVAEGYGNKCASEIANEAYQYRLKRQGDGDERPDEEIGAEFYGRVYPQFSTYRAARSRENPEANLKDTLDEFIHGEDLRTSE
ncbi:hypothetical protein KJ596_01315 [Patescibacteria group bacterium]|nr:hypothetical protein [Patescibacteria group bacterium]MBU1868501.1 hypothetical protein [Patescibacteria group bacterium]